MEAEEVKERAKQRDEEEKAFGYRIANAVSDATVSLSVLLVSRHIFHASSFRSHINSGCLRFSPFFASHPFFWLLIRPRLL